MVAALAVAKRQLRIAVSPNHNCKDHEARILIDDEDLLGKDSCGLDPPDLAHQLASNDLRIRIGRCSCGTVGCDDIFATVGERTVSSSGRRAGGQLSSTNAITTAKLNAFYAIAVGRQSNGWPNLPPTNCFKGVR
jgi:hypothetical protein